MDVENTVYFIYSVGTGSERMNGNQGLGVKYEAVQFRMRGSGGQKWSCAWPRTCGVIGRRTALSEDEEEIYLLLQLSARTEALHMCIFNTCGIYFGVLGSLLCLKCVHRIRRTNSNRPFGFMRFLLGDKFVTGLIGTITQF